MFSVHDNWLNHSHIKVASRRNEAQWFKQVLDDRKIKKKTDETLRRKRFNTEYQYREKDIASPMSNTCLHQTFSYFCLQYATSNDEIIIRFDIPGCTEGFYKV